MLKIMLPDLMPVQVPAPVQTPPAPVQTIAKPQRVRILAPVPDPAPVVVNKTPPVVNATLVAGVVNVPDVIQAPVVETPMEVEDEDSLLQRLFFKRFGRALPEEKEKEKEKDDVDLNMELIDLTEETEEMEVAIPVPVEVVVKTEPIEIANVNLESVITVADVAKRRSFRLERLELAKARKAITEFGKSLRKTEVIPEKEAPLAASNVIADTDSDMSEDRSAKPESGNTVMTVEQAIAETDAAIAS